MNREDAYIVFNDIVRDVLGDEAPAVEDTTSDIDIPGWDSLAYISVLAAIEIRFGVHIRASEANRLTTAGDLVDLVLRKVPSLPVD
jgi:acyl carrier protein